mmetsp:Transcript_109365/g.244056  ORF Transcript_109365/g.244056 Transcript_109365/m.244056 type:complete len:181 (+) Transcript_109365:2-544(+)
MAYIVVASYTMVSLITGIISEKLIAAQMADAEQRAQEIEVEKRDLQTKVLKLLEDFDTDGNGLLTGDEVRQALIGHPHLISILAAMEIYVDDSNIDNLISQLGMSSGEEVAIGKVAMGITHMQGYARASTVFDIKQHMDRLEMKVDEYRNELRNEIRNELRNELRAITSGVQSGRGGSYM